MNQKEYQNLIVPFSRIGQVGFFTKDIFSAMKMWDENMGVNNWTLYEHTNERLQNVVIREGICNKEFKFYCACGNMNGGIQLELIQPVYGLPFYENYLSEHGEGAHHIKEIVPADKYDDALEYYDRIGMPIIFGAEYLGSRFYFIDSISRLGVLLEIGNGCSPCDVPDNWKGTYPDCMVQFGKHGQ